MKKLFTTLIAAAIVLAYTNATAQRTRIGNSTHSRMTESRQLLESSLQGSILFTDNNTLQQLQQEWGANIPQAAGNQVKVELWQVNYIPDRKDNNFTDILLMQKLDANVSYQPGQNSIGYSISYRPVTGNLVVIAYAVLPRQRGNFRNARALSNTNSNIKINGKPSDGTPASLGHQFRSDAKKYLGGNVIYGIYSLPQGTNSLSNADFRVGAPADPNCKNCDVFSDAWNTVTDVVNDAANFVKATVTGAADAIANLGESIIIDNGSIGVECFGVIATFLQTGDTPQARMLSDSHYGNAYNIANSTIFMNTLPPPDRIIVTNLMTVDKRMFTLPIKTGDQVFILMNMGKGFDDPLNYNRNGEDGDVFIHELTHAWQIWHNNLLMLFADGAVNQFKNTVISNQYHYDCDGHNLTDSYNEEQQAMIVENFYSALFFRPDLLGKVRNSVPCGFEQQWTVQNILGNQPANINAQFKATGQMIYLSWDKATAANTGGLPGRTLAVPSNGNRTDGSGYYLQGKINNSFFYYSNKTNAVSANWGPVRDKYTRENYEFGELGWPEANEAMLRDGAGFAQKFNHGYIYWHPSYGVHTVLNKIYDAWKTTGLEAGKLGYPIADYISQIAPQANNRLTEYADKGYQKFLTGVIFYARPTSRAALLNNSDQNFATIEYGDPDRIIAMHTINTTPRRAEEVATNSQPQPGAAKPNPGSTVQRRSDAVELNPQPLPPKIKQTATKKPAPSAKVEINPQPLPPKN